MFIAHKLQHRWHRRATAGVCAFVVVSMACSKHVSPARAGVYTKRVYLTPV